MRALRHNRETGFTIVELLIVIVVIAILASISIVAYNGIQARANDSKVKTAANQIEKAVQIWAVETGNQPYSGSQSTGPVSNNTCPGSTVASGFAGNGAYACTLADLLIAKGKLPANFFSSLPGNTNYSAYRPDLTFMFYQCYPTSNNRYALYWNLAAPTPEETARLNDLIATCGNSTAVRDSWGMRAGKIIQL